MRTRVGDYYGHVGGEVVCDWDPGCHLVSDVMGRFDGDEIGYVLTYVVGGCSTEVEFYADVDLAYAERPSYDMMLLT